jgi:hypothetical protein
MEKERKERRSGRREKVIKETRCWKRSGNWEWECEGKGKKLKLEVEWNGKEKESVALEWNRERKAWEWGSWEWLGSGNSMVVAIRSQCPSGSEYGRSVTLPVSWKKDRELVRSGKVWERGNGKEGKRYVDKVGRERCEKLGSWERWNWEWRKNDGKAWEVGKEVEIRMSRVGTREGKEGMGRKLELEGKRKEGKE